VETYDVLAGHREHPERVLVAQCRLRREGQPGEVCKGLDAIGADSGLVERLSVVRDVVVGVAHRPPEPLELQGAQLLERCGLDGVQVVGLGAEVVHGVSSRSRGRS